MEEIAGSRVLVVDDDDGVREVLCDALVESGAMVLAAANGEEAVRRIAAGTFDLVILDMLMPGLSGLDTLRMMRNHAPTQPVVVLTAVADVGTAVKAMQLGALDYMLKPLTVDQLLIKVTEALERSGPAREGLERVARMERAMLMQERRLEQRDREIMALNKLFQSAIKEPA